MLLPPRRSYNSARHGLTEKIVGALATRSEVTASAARRHLPDDIESWGKIKILPDGDIIHAASSLKAREDGRDATYIRVSIVIFMASQAGFERRQHLSHHPCTLCPPRIA